MTNHRWAELKSVFMQVLELEHGDRTAFLDEACGADTELRQEVDRLLGQHDHAAGFLTDDVAQPTRLAEQATGQDTIPSRIGPYEVIDLLGDGGMGVVYLAQQEHPHRKVAIKVIRAGVTTQSTLRRFQHEAEILGWLQHHGIAQVYSANTTETASGTLPYFVMEYIRGNPLLEHIRTTRPALRDRLELCIQIADAVHYAHQKGVIHRDLKPSNILIDEHGQSKILDFGVARVTDPDLRLSTMETYVGQLVGTFAYMSPEQITGNPAQVDTRSDIYALGVIIYEVLTGRLPVPVDGYGIAEVSRRIREAEPVPIGKLDRTLRGDLETIVHKALEKEKDRRYASAAGLAADLRRFLDCEPIAARPPSTWYRTRVFSRRHRGLVIGVVSSFVLLVAGIAGTSWQAMVARNERNMAQAEAARAKQIIEFLNGMLARARPQFARGKDVSIREALDDAVARIGSESTLEPDLEGMLRHTIGNTYYHLGVYDVARDHIEQAVTLLKTSLGVDHQETLSAMNNLALAYKDMGRLDLTEPLILEVMEGRRRTLGEQHPETLSSMNNAAMLLNALGRYDDAEPLMRRAWEGRRKALGPDDRATLTTLDNLATILRNLGRYEEADRAVRQALDGLVRTQGDDDPATLTVRFNLGNLLTLQERFEEAIPHLRLTAEGRRRVLGSNHLWTAGAVHFLGYSLQRAGHAEEAESALREAVSIAERNSPAGDRFIPEWRGDLGLCLLAQRRYDDAEQELLAAYEQIAIDTTPVAQTIIQGLVDLYIATDRMDEAEAFRARLKEA